MKKIFILRGVPGVGKTSWVKENNLADYVISPDMFRLILSPPVNGAINQSVSKEAWELTEMALRSRLRYDGITVIDATHLDNRSIEKWKKIADAFGAELVLVDFMIGVDWALVVERNKGREGTIRYIPPEVLRRMWDKSCSQDLTGFTVVSPATAL